jgi:hypothetical protein
LYFSYSSALFDKLTLLVLREVWELTEEHTVEPAKEWITDFSYFSPITALVLKMD